jgi:chromosome segregation ATPase
MDCSFHVDRNIGKRCKKEEDAMVSLRNVFTVPNGFSEVWDNMSSSFNKVGSSFVSELGLNRRSMIQLAGVISVVTLAVFLVRRMRTGSSVVEKGVEASEEVQKEKEALQNEITNLKGKVKELEGAEGVLSKLGAIDPINTEAYKKLNESYDSEKKKNALLKGRVKVLEEQSKRWTEFEQLLGQVSSGEDLEKGAIQSLNSIVSAKDELERKCKALEQEVRDIDTVKDASLKKVSDLKGKLTESKQLLKEKTESYGLVEQERDVQQQELKDLKQRAQENKTEKNKLSEIIDRLEKQIQSNKTALEQGQAKAVEAAEEKVKQAKQILELEQKLQDLKNHHAQLSEESSALRKKIKGQEEESRKRVDELREVPELKTRIQSVEAEKQTLLGQVAQLESTLEERTQKIALIEELQKKIESETQRAHELSEKNQEQSKEIENRVAENKTLRLSESDLSLLSTLAVQAKTGGEVTFGKTDMAKITTEAAKNIYEFLKAYEKIVQKNATRSIEQESQKSRANAAKANEVMLKYKSAYEKLREENKTLKEGLQEKENGISRDGT